MQLHRKSKAESGSGDAGGVEPGGAANGDEVGALEASNKAPKEKASRRTTSLLNIFMSNAHGKTRKH